MSKDDGNNRTLSNADIEMIANIIDGSLDAKLKPIKDGLRAAGEGLRAAGEGLMATGHPPSAPTEE